MQLGCDVYGLGTEMQKDMDGTLRKLSEYGITGIEPIFSFPGDTAILPESPIPDRVKAIMWNEEKVNAVKPLLDKYGLEISSMVVSFIYSGEPEQILQDVLEFAKRTGNRRFVTSMVFDTPEKEAKAARILNRAAELFAGTGITLFYHNHWQEFTRDPETNMMLLERFLKDTAPDVKLQIDVGWIMYSGYDPVRFMEKHADRIMSVHLKDFVAGYDKLPQEDAFAAVGAGVLPLKDILDHVGRLNLMDHGLMIDQDAASKGGSILEEVNYGAAKVRDLMY